MCFHRFSNFHWRLQVRVFDLQSNSHRSIFSFLFSFSFFFFWHRWRCLEAFGQVFIFRPGKIPTGFFFIFYLPPPPSLSLSLVLPLFLPSLLFAFVMVVHVVLDAWYTLLGGSEQKKKRGGRNADSLRTARSASVQQYKWRSNLPRIWPHLRVLVASAWRKLIDGHSQVASPVFFSLGVCENNSSLFFLA